MSLVLASFLAWSASAAAPTPPRVDLYGDPLPAGAVARMGTVRLRHAGMSDYAFPSNNAVLTCGGDRMLRWWDLASGKQTRAVRLAGTGGPGRLVTVSNNCKTLAAHVGQNLVLWDVETGKELSRIPTGAKSLNYLYFHPEGQTLGVGEPDGNWTLHEWKAKEQRTLTVPRAEIPGRPRQFNPDSTTHCNYSPDGKWVLAQTNSIDPLGVFDFASGRLVHRLACHACTTAVSPDSKTLVAASRQNDKGGDETVLRFFDLATGKEVKQYPQGTNLSFYSLAFSPDGKHLACGFSDESRVVEVATGKVVHRLTDRPIAMSYTPDGKRLLATNGYGLRVWDAATGKELHDRGQPIGTTLAAAVSPDGATVAVADWMDQAVSLWDTGTGRLRRQLPEGGEKRYVRDLSFSPDGKTLTAAQAMGFVQRWEVGSAKAVCSFHLAGPGQGQARSMYC